MGKVGCECGKNGKVGEANEVRMESDDVDEEAVTYEASHKVIRGSDVSFSNQR